MKNVIIIYEAYLNWKPRGLQKNKGSHKMNCFSKRFLNSFSKRFP